MPAPQYRPARTWRSRPLFGALGLRGPSVQHSQAEGQLLRRYAGTSSVTVELGVAEGGSAWEAASVMPPDGTLYLIDPYMHQRGPIGAAQMVARRLVRSVARGNVRWLREFSNHAVRGWSTPIDFLFIDGDHTYEGVRRDWKEWTPHVKVDGHAALHDAHPDGAWTADDHGPVRWLKEILEAGDWEITDHVDSLAVLRRARA